MTTAAERLASRRRVLKGMMGGAAISVGLPFLDCFLNSNGTALAASGQALPVVYGSWYWGLGFNSGRWEPKTAGKIVELAPETQPLERFKDKVNIYSGMKVYLDGKPNMVHFTGAIAALTGTVPRSNTVLVPTLDTMIADQIGSNTRFKSLELAPSGDPRHMYSFRPGGVFQPAEGSAAALYARIFGPDFRDPNAADFKPYPQVMARQSVLSWVKEQRKDIEKTLGASDRARLDEYFTSLRQIERQVDIQLQKPAPLEACSLPDQPDEGPMGNDVDVISANHKLFAQLAAHAYACDQTHVVNMSFCELGSTLRQAGSQMTFHIYTHEEAIDEKLGCQPTTIFFIRRVMEAFGDYLAALSSIKEGDKTLLDRALIFAATDTGYARIHSLDNLPMITAGGAGGRIKTGLHISAPTDPVTRVGLTIQQALGLPLNSWGTDSMATSKTITEVLA
jgi:hypothetical protein